MLVCACIEMRWLYNAIRRKILMLNMFMPDEVEKQKFVYSLLSDF